MAAPTKEISSEIVRQVATRRAMGVPLRDLSKEFGLPVYTINKAINSDMGKAIVKEVIDNAVAGAVIQARRGLSDLVEASVQVIKDQLAEGNLEAAKMVLKGIGLDQAEKQDLAQQQAITVILPGKAEPKDIEHG